MRQWIRENLLLLLTALCWALALVLYLLCVSGCAPVMHRARLHYLSRPFAEIALTSRWCGSTTRYGILVEAQGEATCPDLDDVDDAAEGVLSVGKVYGAVPESLLGVTVVYTLTAIDCRAKGDESGRAAFVRGCTFGDDAAVQEGGPLSIGFPMQTTRHELGHALLYRLGVADVEDAWGNHTVPAAFWNRIDHREAPITTYSHIE